MCQTKHPIAEWSIELTPQGGASWESLNRRSCELMARMVRRWSSEVNSEQRIEVRSRCRDGKSRRPVAFVKHPSHSTTTALRLRLSTSHIEGAVAAAVSRSRIGIDLVDIRNPLAPSFLTTWFDRNERIRIGTQPPHAFWAAKEAAYKAFCRCEPFRPNRWKIVSVENDSAKSHPSRCTVRNDRNDAMCQLASIEFHFVDRFAVAVAQPHSVLEQTIPHHSNELLLGICKP
ncbi:hypothetical protein CA13_05870 [Planctomycetes bacterium CA13]|uniref:4'-phosphopantetheinyl transferase domain-containing protein n=1 Tax=Novipirellula herctigrandis TaxID=2527986 RepID=A0A5C5YVU1_9BACT|nr:hypothetical protein CA13_05870 [Planctomycetes bacterium CA13]